MTWAFDLGLGSIGEAVQQKGEFKHAASWLVPSEFASTKAARTRRRMWRTRQAHKARESWLNQCLRSAGMEVLVGRRVERGPQGWTTLPGDPRLEREFPSAGDTTCYNSALLRIRLLRGETLAPWQVYKALHAAIQRRGYDPNIPWKSGASRSTEEKEEGETRARAAEYQSLLEDMAPGRTEFHYPCYLQAWKMRLWNPGQPEVLQERVSHDAESIHGMVAPRTLVEKEVRDLVAAAARYHPQLAGQADFILWGPACKPYASHNGTLRKQHGLRQGSEEDWEGVMGQKIPRFDNRIIEKCALIPRFNVCKMAPEGRAAAQPDAALPREVAFLMKLKNLRFSRGGGIAHLEAAEIATLFEKRREALSLTQKQWETACEKLGGRPLPPDLEVKAPRLGGRSAFCRPALKHVKELILSGKSPRDFHAEALARLHGNTNPQKGLVPADLDFLLRMGDSWEGLYLPNKRLEAISSRARTPDEAIREVIGSVNDPIVRHRLQLFVERLDELETRFGPPDQVALEFVREDFMGEKAKIEYRKFLNRREKERKEAREQAGQLGATSGSSGLKMELFKAQRGQCLYSGQRLHETKIEDYVIEHIVPRAKRGPDAVINYVLTTEELNNDKSDHIPFEWPYLKKQWDAYTQRVESCAGALGVKRVRLLVSPDAVELAQKYTALAETAWISKLAQTILNLKFGWTNGNTPDGRKAVVVVPGGLTARIRRKYSLNSLLAGDGVDEEEAEKKNRKDHRHHALDAMVISFLPGWVANPDKEHFFRFPEPVRANPRGFFQTAIHNVVPRQLCFEKGKLEETIYARRTIAGNSVAAVRQEFRALAFKSVGINKTEFNLDYLYKQTDKILEPRIRQLVQDFASTEPNEAAWERFCDEVRLPRKDGHPGPHVRRVRMRVGPMDEFKNLSKDRAASGAYRKGSTHHGQWVYRDATGRSLVRPVYAFESAGQVRRELIAMHGLDALVGYFQSGCLVELVRPVAHKKTPLAPGQFSLNTLRKDGFAVVTDARGRKSEPISLKTLLESGFHRVTS